MSTTSLVHGAIDWRAPVVTLLRKIRTGWEIFLLANRRAELANELCYLSDAELARRGLTRAQIGKFVTGSDA